MYFALFICIYCSAFPCQLLANKSRYRDVIDRLHSEDNCRAPIKAEPLTPSVTHLFVTHSLVVVVVVVVSH